MIILLSTLRELSHSLAFFGPTEKTPRYYRYRPTEEKPQEDPEALGAGPTRPALPPGGQVPQKPTPRRWSFRPTPQALPAPEEKEKPESLLDKVEREKRAQDARRKLTPGQQHNPYRTENK